MRPESPGIHCRVRCCFRKIVFHQELLHGDMGAGGKVRGRPGGLGAAFSLVSVIRDRPRAVWGGIAGLDCGGASRGCRCLSEAALDGPSCSRRAAWVLRNARRRPGSSRYGSGPCPPPAPHRACFGRTAPPPAVLQLWRQPGCGIRPAPVPGGRCHGEPAALGLCEKGGAGVGCRAGASQAAVGKPARCRCCAEGAAKVCVLME